MEEVDHSEDSSEWIIASDSEYLVKGITEWLPNWKVRFPFSNPDTRLTKI